MQLIKKYEQILLVIILTYLFLQFTAIFICLGSVLIAGATVAASKLMHKRLLDNVMHSPMMFFDMTPIGRIVNRFSKDLDTIDVLLPSNLRAWVSCLIAVRSVTKNVCECWTLMVNLSSLNLNLSFLLELL